MSKPSLRNLLRRYAPDPAMRTLRSLRASLAQPPIEQAVLFDYSFEPEDNGKPRINIVIPDLDTVTAFGGVNTAIEFFLLLLKNLRRKQDVSLRFICERRVPPERCVVYRIAETLQIPLGDVDIVFIDGDGTIKTRPYDIFISYNWWTSLNIYPILKKQSSHYNIGKIPKIHFFQEYEPLFFPMSASHMIICQAFNMDWPTWMIFNSTELQRFYLRMGNRADRSFVFEPVLNPALKPFLSEAREALRQRQILVYGRPSIRRNCFDLICSALEIWAESKASSDWRVISAGEAHKTVPLPNGRALESVGKLSLADYAKLLGQTAIGLSLMASPHPSYPPLEMAHFGVRVLTNSYVEKDLSTRHDNITSLHDIRPQAIAAALNEACAAFECDPEAGLRGKSHMPGYLKGQFDCLEDVATAIESLWA